MPESPRPGLGRAKLLAALLLLSSAFAALPARAAVPFMLPRYAQAVALMPNGKIIVAGGASFTDVPMSSVEILDITRGSEFVTPAEGALYVSNPGGAMAVARSSATITVLPNGNVLVTGGFDGAIARSDGEVYNPNLNTWTTTANSMAVGRYNHTATLLLTGKVLVCGGQTNVFPAVPAVTATCDLYDPATNTFAATGSMLLGRELHSATILNDGTVWVAGGWNNDPAVNSNPPFIVTTERYNAGTGSWQQAQPLNISRAYHTATLTGDNKVLVAGGFNGRNVNFKLTVPTAVPTILNIPSQGVLNSSELFDPTGGSVVPGPPILTRVENHASALLPNGLVSIYGGRGNIEPSNIASVVPAAVFTNGATVDGNFTGFTSTLAVQNITSGSGVLAGDANGLFLSFHLGTPVTGSIIDGDLEFIHPVVHLSGGDVVLNSNFDVPGFGLRAPLKGYNVGCDAAGVCGYVQGTFPVLNMGAGTYSLSMPVNATNILASQGVTGTLFITPHPISLTVQSGVAAITSSGGNISNFTTNLKVAMPSFLVGKNVRNITLTLTPSQTAGWTEKSSYTAILNGGSGSAPGPFLVKSVAGVTFIDLPNFTFTNVTGTLFVIASDLTYQIPNPDSLSFSVPLQNAGIPGSALMDNAAFSLKYSADGIDLSGQTLTFDSADIIIRDMLFGDNLYFIPNINQWAYQASGFKVTRPGLTRTGASSLVTPSGAEFDIGGRECTAGCAGFAAASFGGAGVWRPDNATLWSPTATSVAALPDPMTHAFHTATLLVDGTILLAGGTNGSTVLPSAEVFDPKTARFTPTTTPMKTARQQHSASLLPNGRVLLAGGFSANAISTGPTSDTEIYYPETQVFLTAPPMISSHSQHTAITMPNGNVFVAGGYKGINTVTPTAEVYLSTLAVWRALPDMTTAAGGTGTLEKRAIAAAVQLQDGRIMLCGGTNESGILATTIAYDPTANTWAALAPMPTPLQGHTATLLFDGRVLVAGGDDGFGETKSSFIFDPKAGALGTWSVANPMESARVGHNATLLPNGVVMVSGGVKAQLTGNSTANAIRSIEYFVPDAADWEDGSGPDGSPTEDVPGYLMSSGARAFHTTTLAPNGQIYFIGGANGSIASAQSASFYTQYDSIYFTVSPDQFSINNPSLRQSTIAATTASPFLPLSNFNVTGLRFRGATEAAGGAGAANSSFSTPRLMLQKVDGASGGGSNSSPGFVVDLTTKIYANPANLTTLNTSLTVALPDNNALPYGWYMAWVGATDIHTAKAPFVQVGPPKPAVPVSFTASTVLGVSSVTYTWTGIPAPCDGYNIYSSTTGVFIASVAYAGTGVGGTSFTRTGLMPNTTTSILVAGYTITGDGPLKGSATAYTFASAPSNVSITSVTFNSLRVEWDANGNTDGTIYEVSQSTDWPAPFTQSVSTPVPSFFATTSTGVAISQLLPNTTYTFRIQAFNTGGLASNFSSFASTQTRSAVSGVTGKALTSTSIQWSWNTTNGVTSYNVYNATSSDIIISTTATTFVDSGLRVNASRSIAVTAVTAAGEGPLSTSATVFTLANVPVPANPAVTSLSTYSFVVGWSPSDGNPLGTSYHIVFYEFGDTAVKVTTIVPTGFVMDTLAQTLNLLPGVRYDTYVTAINGDNVPSAPLIISTYTFAQTPQFVAPVFLGITPTTIQLQWDRVGNSTKTAYEVTFSTDASFALALATAVPFSAGFTGSSTTLTGLQTALQYFIRVRGMNPLGQVTQYSFSTNTLTTNGGAAPGQLAGTLYANNDSVISGNLGDGRAVRLISPPGAFPSDTVATLAPYNVVPGSTLCPGGFNVAVTITDNPALQPVSPLYLTADYDPTSLGITPTSQIALMRYDPSGVCVPLDTVFYPNTLPRPTFRARINHFSQYQLVQIPLAASAATARIFPNPFRAGHDSYVTIDQVPPGARVRIMTLRGELVLDQVANSYGLLNWTGTNGGGRHVASGLYIVLVEASGAQKMTKLAVIR